MIKMTRNSGTEGSTIYLHEHELMARVFCKHDCNEAPAEQMFSMYCFKGESWG